MSNSNMDRRENNTAADRKKNLGSFRSRSINAAVAVCTAIFAAAAGFAFAGNDDKPLTAEPADMKDMASSVKVELPPEEYDVKINVDGKNIVVRAAGKVKDAIEAADINVFDDDLINVGLSEPLNPNTEIVINRVDIVEEVQVKVLEYATKYREDDSYTIGYSETIVDGEEGEMETTLRHTYVDGELVSSSVIDTDITEPVDKVVVVGTKEYNPIDDISISQIPAPLDLVLDDNGVPLEYSQVFTGKSTAYSARAGARTASGRLAEVGTVAVDPSLIPYGSELYIVSTDGSTVYGYAIAADTGTALIDGTVLVDVFMESYEASCRWGAKQVNVYVLD